MFGTSIFFFFLKKIFNFKDKLKLKSNFIEKKHYEIFDTKLFLAEDPYLHTLVEQNIHTEIFTQPAPKKCFLEVWF